MNSFGNIKEEHTSGNIPTVNTKLGINDILGAFKARWGIGRMKYIIEPGLYAVGSPDENSPVLVSANYKLSFDYLRRELNNIDAWIMVLDTGGINVWCAAGKGSFGTNEIIKHIKETNIDKVVNHHRLIVPQLGAPGVAAHIVKKETGFKIIYGPVRASDIPAFIESGGKALKEMRRVSFNMYDRLVLTPVEIVMGFKYLIILIAIIFILSGLSSTGYSVSLALASGAKASLLLFAFLSGVLITPLLLPFIPGRSFALKGFIVGSITFILISQLFSGYLGSGIMKIIEQFLIFSSISSFTAMNFTGASTYTSLSGVKKEMSKSLPLQITGFSAGIVLFFINKFI